MGEGDDLSVLVVGTAAEAVTVLWAGRGSMPLWRDGGREAP